MRRLAILIVAAAVALPAGQGTAADRLSTSAPPLAVGASVMLGAKSLLEPQVDVNAAVSRQPTTIVTLLQGYRDRGQLPGRVVVQMGENGPVSAADIRGLRAALRGVSEVLLVNVHVPRAWQGEVNATLSQTAHDWGPAHLVDWHDTATSALLYPDGIHLNPAGQKVYAEMIRHELAKYRPAPAAAPAPAANPPSNAGGGTSYP